VLAGTAMFPIIVALAILTGIVTGWLASLALLDLTTPEFIKGLKLFYRFKDTWFGLFKSATFGFTITLVGCVVGLATRGGAEGVGLSTTRAVVYSAVLLARAGRVLGAGTAAMIQFQDLHKSFARSRCSPASPSPYRTRRPWSSSATRAPARAWR